MRKLILSLFALMLSAASSNAEIIGYESFDYDDDTIVEGQSGGYGWDINGQRISGTGELESPLYTGDPSEWLDFELVTTGTGTSGNPVTDGAVSSGNSANGQLIRRFNSDEWYGALRPEGGPYFFAVTMTSNGHNPWGGISAYDFGTEKPYAGLIYQSDSGVTQFYGLDCNPNAPSVVAVEKDVPARIVMSIDANIGMVRFWVNPDGNDDYSDESADASIAIADASRIEAGNWLSGVRLAADVSVTWDDLVVATSFDEVFVKSTAPSPAHKAKDIPVAEDLTLSWNAANADDITSYSVYFEANDPNFNDKTPIASISSWTGDRIEYTINQSILAKDDTYYWRVDGVTDSGFVKKGLTWQLETQKSLPVINSATDYIVVAEGDQAEISVDVASETPETYQWFKYVDGVNDDNLSGNPTAQTSALVIDNVTSAETGEYYCKINNLSGTEVTSVMCILDLQRAVAKWTFEKSYDSVVEGSPTSLLVNEPNFVAGFDGYAAEFDGTEAIYTDPAQISYFNKCNISMSVSCWFKSTNPADWAAIVSRYGESGRGWQLRKFSDANNGRNLCFTTRGTGNEDGSPTDARGIDVFDGEWHYIVGTFEDTVKKVYVDGFEAASDEIEVPIAYADNPVAIGGRAYYSDENEVWEVDTAMQFTADDVTIYNYALDAIAVAQIYANVTGTEVCVTYPEMDFDDDCKVTVSDFAFIARSWLTDNNVYPEDVE